MPHGCDLVLLHGFTHTGASWEPVVGALGERFRSIAPDIRGHGAAGNRQPADLSGVLDDVAAQAPPRFVLAGYSMGGRLALHVALAEPDRVARLVLIGASPGIADPAEREARRASDEALADDIERSTIKEFVLRWAQTPVLAGLDPLVLERVHEDRLRNTPAGLARALRGLGTGALPSLWGRLDELAMPVTLVVGERDQRFQAVAREMAARAPQAHVEVVAGAGHAVHLEAPVPMAEIIGAAPAGDPR
ncbi:MAG: 2-succinyl-6-hydroxy-2,4-cyclohexadiene-1-carboxylate synthase [Solirubrobacteraceae bacterium]